MRSAPAPVPHDPPPHPRPRAHSLSSRAGAGVLGRSAAQGAAQANSGRSALPRLLRDATRASHWPLFIAHSFHWAALRDCDVALSAARSPPEPPAPGSPPRLSPRRNPAQPAYPTPRPPRIPKPEPQALGHSGSPPPPPRLPPSGKPRQEGHQALEDARACLHHGSCPPSSCQSPRWSRRGARRGRPGLPQQVLPNPRRPSFSCPVRAGPEPPTFSKVPAGISRAVLVQSEGAPEAQPGCGPARRHPWCLDLGQVSGLLGV